MDALLLLHIHDEHIRVQLNGDDEFICGVEWQPIDPLAPMGLSLFGHILLFCSPSQLYNINN